MREECNRIDMLFDDGLIPDVLAAARSCRFRLHNALPATKDVKQLWKPKKRGVGRCVERARCVERVTSAVSSA